MTWRLPRAFALFALPLALAAGACTERLETSNGCPLLCPGQAIDIVDTVLDPAVVLDTTLGGNPILGFESPLLLASRGDTLDLRPIFRFDSLTRKWTPSGGALQDVDHVDSAAVIFRIFRSTIKTPLQFTLEAYDVTDTLLPDTIPTTLLPLFQPGRLLGSVTIDSANFKDSATVRIPLDSAFLRQRIQSGEFLRVGIRVRSTESAQFQLTTSVDETNGPRIRYRISPDTLVSPIVMSARSLRPTRPSAADADLNDYLLVADAPALPAPGRIVVGGLPSMRTYLRFELPRWLTDSVAVVRAQLELTQEPVRALDAADSIPIRAQLVLATNTTQDLNRAARLLAPAGTFPGDQLRLTPGDSGVRKFEINAFVRAWRLSDASANVPQALVLRSDLEGFSVLGVRFYGLEAPAGLRPRLRVSYVPQSRYGQP